MPKISPQWWFEQIDWAARKAVQLSGSTKFLTFIADIKQVVDAIVEVLSNIPFDKPFKIGMWVLLNRDPLKEARIQMQEMRKRWGNVP